MRQHIEQLGHSASNNGLSNNPLENKYFTEYMNNKGVNLETLDSNSMPVRVYQEGWDEAQSVADSNNY